VDGATNAPAGGGADGEVALDIQIAGGVAPGAAIAVYFAANTEAGFADAVSAATHDATHAPSVISISWGGVEMAWPAQAVTTMNTIMQDAASLGISVFAASGDQLATDGIDDGLAHVVFPASSPWAIGCGGTATTIEGQAIITQTVWNDGADGTGGGISDLFAAPGFQKSAPVPPGINGGRRGRGVPDVAGNAALASGYAIIADGAAQVAGGTSAVAPLWAGLAARINQQAARPIGFFLSAVYGRTELFMEVTAGSNKPAGSPIGYDAGPVWNACTGLGTPRGQALADALSGATRADEGERG
jgi:kumamolisin